MSDQPGAVNATAPARNFSAQAELAVGPVTIGPPGPVETKPFDPEPHRERMRGWLAMLFVGAYLLLIGFFVLGVAFKWLDIATTKELAALALPTLTGLTGTVVGFYYAGGKG